LRKGAYADSKCADKKMDNPITGDKTCPKGFDAVVMAKGFKYDNPSSTCEVDIYFCVGKDKSIDDWLFGGELLNCVL
jgi:hypothetical protein